MLVVVPLVQPLEHVGVLLRGFRHLGDMLPLFVFVHALACARWNRLARPGLRLEFDDDFVVFDELVGQSTVGGQLSLARARHAVEEAVLADVRLVLHLDLRERHRLAVM